jgi:hypothetical protein
MRQIDLVKLMHFIDLIDVEFDPQVGCQSQLDFIILTLLGESTMRRIIVINRCTCNISDKLKVFAIVEFS